MLIAFIRSLRYWFCTPSQWLSYTSCTSYTSSSALVFRCLFKSVFKDLLTKNSSVFESFLTIGHYFSRSSDIRSIGLFIFIFINSRWHQEPTFQVTKHLLSYLRSKSVVMVNAGNWIQGLPVFPHDVDHSPQIYSVGPSGSTSVPKSVSIFPKQLNHPWFDFELNTIH